MNIISLDSRVGYIKHITLSALLFALTLLSTRLYAEGLSAVALNVQLTQAEQNYLNLKPKLTHCDDPNWMPYSKNENGSHIGITADYLELIANTLGVELEYVATTSWQDTLEKAKSRECDLITALVDKPDRHEYLDFTQGYLDTSLSLATLSSAPNISKLQALDGKRVAVVKGYASTAYIRSHFPNLILVEVSDLEEGLKYVADGRAYGVAGTLGVLAYTIQNHYFGKIKLNGTFTNDWKQSVGTRNDEPLLGQIIAKVISSIPDNTHKHIFTHWLSDSVLDRDANDLTLKELEFLSQHPVIRFQVRSSSAPFEYQKDGKAYGLAVDYIDDIAKRLGFKAEYVVSDMEPELAIAELNKQEKQFDTLALLVADREREKTLVFGDTYLSFPVVIVTNEESTYINSLSELSARRVVLEEGYLTNKWVARDYPSIEIVNVANTKQALQMVDDGEVDAYVGNLAIANYFQATGELNNIKVAAPTEYGNVHFKFVAPSQWPELVSILSKGYRQMTPAEHTVIREKWFTLHKVEKKDYTLLIVVVIASVVLLIAGGIWNARVRREKNNTEQALEKLKEVQNTLKRTNEELRVLSLTDALTGLSNRVKLESVLEDQLQYAKRYEEYEFAIIMVDIDNFKQINDTHGHQVGDQVLKFVSSLFIDNIRVVDTVGRWGGEEFLIICPQTDEKGVTIVAEKLRKLIESQDISEVGRVTASFGTTSFRSEDSCSEELLARADQALYCSKDGGRNRVTLYLD